jgi:6-phosphogluconate dehydrogenase (decarboxylating)
VRRALYCSKMVSYAQGYMLLRAAEKDQGWHLNMGGIALMWRGGCIIRSVFLGNIKAAFDKNPDLSNLLLDDFFSSALNKYQASWRKAIVHAIEIGVPTPAFSTALAFYDGYRTARLPANLFRRSATSSARTPTSEWTSRAASSSTPTGPDAAAAFPHRRTTLSLAVQNQRGQFRESGLAL